MLEYTFAIIAKKKKKMLRLRYEVIDQTGGINRTRSSQWEYRVEYQGGGETWHSQEKNSISLAVVAVRQILKVGRLKKRFATM